MDVYKAARMCREIRQFKPDAIPEDTLNKVLTAGRWSASSRNQQPWHFIVVTDRDALRSIGDIASSGRFIADAPLAIAIVMEGAHRPELDAGRAMQQMKLVAWELGLGTCFVGVRDPDQNNRIKELLAVPQDMELVTVIPFGYLPEDVRGGGKRRKPLEEIVHRERFRQS